MGAGMMNTNTLLTETQDLQTSHNPGQRLGQVLLQMIRASASTFKSSPAVSLALIDGLFVLLPQQPTHLIALRALVLLESGNVHAAVDVLAGQNHPLCTFLLAQCDKARGGTEWPGLLQQVLVFGDKDLQSLAQPMLQLWSGSETASSVDSMKAHL
jgi:hypothetical protein